MQELRQQEGGADSFGAVYSDGRTQATLGPHLLRQGGAMFHPAVLNGRRLCQGLAEPVGPLSCNVC